MLCLMYLRSNVKGSEAFQVNGMLPSCWQVFEPLIHAFENFRYFSKCCVGNFEAFTVLKNVCGML